MLRTGEKARHHFGFNRSALKFNRSAVLKNWPAFFQERPGCLHRRAHVSRLELDSSLECRRTIGGDRPG
jgi:hypothetical protein